MKMTLHSIPHQKGEYYGLSKPQAQNDDSVEKVDGYRDPSGSLDDNFPLKLQCLSCLFPFGLATLSILGEGEN
jgi:hypothetical protein